MLNAEAKPKRRMRIRIVLDHLDWTVVENVAVFGRALEGDQGDQRFAIGVDHLEADVERQGEGAGAGIRVLRDHAITSAARYGRANL